MIKAKRIWDDWFVFFNLSFKIKKYELRIIIKIYKDLE
jgi:hypothetical protein